MDTNTSQPPTRNPQQDAAGGLQANSPELQPLENGSQLNPNQLPKTDNLQVKEQQNSSGTIKVDSNPGIKALTSGTSLWVFSGATLILAVILLIMAKVTKSTAGEKPDNETDETASKTKGAVQKDKVLAAKEETPKQKVKKKTKGSKKKKRKK